MEPVLGPIVADATSGLPVPSVLAQLTAEPFLYASWSADAGLLHQFGPAMQEATSFALLGLGQTREYGTWPEAWQAITSEDSADAVWAAEVSLLVTFGGFDLGVFPESDGAVWSVIAKPVSEASKGCLALLAESSAS